MVVYEKIQFCCGQKILTELKQFFFVDNHYKTLQTSQKSVLFQQGVLKKNCGLWVTSVLDFFACILTF